MSETQADREREEKRDGKGREENEVPLQKHANYKCGTNVVIITSDKIIKPQAEILLGNTISILILQSGKTHWKTEHYTDGFNADAK